MALTALTANVKAVPGKVPGPIFNKIAEFLKEDEIIQAMYVMATDKSEKDRTYEIVCKRLGQKTVNDPHSPWKNPKEKNTSWEEHYSNCRIKESNCRIKERMRKIYKQGRDFACKIPPFLSKGFNGIVSAGLTGVVYGSRVGYGAGLGFLSGLSLPTLLKLKKSEEDSSTTYAFIGSGIGALIAGGFYNNHIFVSLAGTIVGVLGGSLYTNIGSGNSTDKTTACILGGGFGAGATLTTSLLKIATIDKSAILGLGSLVGSFVGNLINSRLGCDPDFEPLKWETIQFGSLIAGAAVGSLIAGISVSAVLGSALIWGIPTISEAADKIINSETMKNVFGRIGGTINISLTALKDSVLNIGSKIKNSQVVKNCFGYIGARFISWVRG
jgi:hypothetical protein